MVAVGRRCVMSAGRRSDNATTWKLRSVCGGLGPWVDARKIGSKVLSASDRVAVFHQITLVAREEGGALTLMSVP